MSSKKKIICGIDISKNWYDVCLSGKNEILRFNNKPEGHKKFIKYLIKQQVKQCIMESTGGYERALSEVLEEQSILFSVVSPSRVRAFARAEGVHAKTDLMDAKLLCMFGEKLSPELTILPSETIKKVRNYITRREQLVEMCSMEKNHLQAPLATESDKNSIKAMIKTLNVTIKEVEKEIEQAIEADQQIKAKSELLRSFAGVGPVSASILLAYLPELGQIDRKTVGAIVGVVPFKNNSGINDSERGRIYGGRKIIRDCLYMATMSAIQCNMYIRRNYQSLKSRGKPHKVVVVACMRKIIGALNAIVRDSKPWDENRFQLSKDNFARQAVKQ